MNLNFIKTFVLLILLVSIGTTLDGVGVPVASSVNVISLDPSVKHQKMLGWEGVAQIGQDCPDCPPILHLWRDEVADRAANELGLNRIRLALKSGSENPTAYYQRKLNDPNLYGDWVDHFFDIQNDNNDPNSINWSGFQFGDIDYAIDNAVLPLKQRVEANGEKLYVNLNYVDMGRSTFEHYNNPDEYAELILATFIHMRDKYGFVPDGVEIILEPDNSPGWSGTQIGQVMVATGDRLKSEGFATPDFIAPSTKKANQALGYLNKMLAVPGVTQYLSELSYHRYSNQPSQSDLGAIANKASQLGIDTSMLEKIKAGHEKLHEDIKYGNVSSWQQFTISFPGSDKGGAYYAIDRSNLSNVKVNLGSRSAYLAQYFRPVRSGAQRIGASSNTGKFDPLAFINTNGSYAVVVKASNGGGDFSIEGLPAGKYGISYSVGNGIQSSADVTISAGQTLDALIPNDGVISIFGKTTGGGQTQPSPTPTATSIPPTPTPAPPTPKPSPLPTASATPSSSVDLVIGNGVANLGETVSVDLILTEAPLGIAGFNIQMEIDDPSVAKITGVRFDSKVSLTSEVIEPDGSKARVIAADLGNPGSMASGDTDIKFATLRLQGLNEGTVAIRFLGVRIDDDSGNNMNANLVRGSFQVLNVIPVVSAGGDATINEGETFTRTGSINDPGDSNWSGIVDYGDNLGAQALAISGSTFDLNHAYGTAGVYDVVVSVMDDNGAAGTDTLQVKVAHVYPTIPGLSDPSQDLDGDGLAEDLNGNGRLDFDDIVKFFKHISSQAIQNNSPDFDFNDNGLIDMDDIVQLFMILVSKFG